MSEKESGVLTMELSAIITSLLPEVLRLAETQVGAELPHLIVDIMARVENAKATYRLAGADKSSVVHALVQALVGEVKTHGDLTPHESMALDFLSGKEVVQSIIDTAVGISKGDFFEQIERGCCGKKRRKKL